MNAKDFWHTMAALYLENADAIEPPSGLALKAKSFADSMLKHARDSGMVSDTKSHTTFLPRLRLPWGGVVLAGGVHGVALDRDRRLIVQFGEGTYVRSPTSTAEVHGFGQQLIESAGLFPLRWGIAGVRLGRVTVAFAERGQVVVALRGGGYLRSPILGDELAQQSIAELEQAMVARGLAR